MEMVQQQNYPVERHSIQTKDGYLLTMYRIPNMNEQRDNRKVILLMHGKKMFYSNIQYRNDCDIGIWIDIDS